MLQTTNQKHDQHGSVISKIEDVHISLDNGQASHDLAVGNEEHMRNKVSNFEQPHL